MNDLNCKGASAKRTATVMPWRSPTGLSATYCGWQCSSSITSIGSIRKVSTRASSGAQSCRCPCKIPQPLLVLFRNLVPRRSRVQCADRGLYGSYDAISAALPYINTPPPFIAAKRTLPCLSSTKCPFVGQFGRLGSCRSEYPVLLARVSVLKLPARLDT